MPSSKLLPIALAFALLTAVGSAFAVEPDEVPLAFLSNSASHESRALKPNSHRKPHGNPAAGIPNIDSLLNFSGRFKADGFDSAGVSQSWWYYNMLGTEPKHGGSTTVNAPLVPVSLTFLTFGPKGSCRGSRVSPIRARSTQLTATPTRAC